MTHFGPTAAQLSDSETIFREQILSSYRFRPISPDHSLRKSLSRKILGFRSGFFLIRIEAKIMARTGGK
jgi:hypothetical protein